MTVPQPPLTVHDVARALRVSRFTVYDLIKRGELPAYRVGNRLRVDPSAIAAYTRQAGHVTDKGASSPAGGGMSLRLTGEDGRTLTLALDDLRQQGMTTIAATWLGAHNFARRRYGGVLLHELLVAHGLVRPVEAWRGALSRYVLAEGQDGHAVVLALGEIDPAYSNVPVLVACEREGRPLGPEEGPLLLVVPSDHRGGRYVRGLGRLIVRDGSRAGAGEAR